MKVYTHIWTKVLGENQCNNPTQVGSKHTSQLDYPQAISYRPYTRNVIITYLNKLSCAFKLFKLF